MRERQRIIVCTWGAPDPNGGASQIIIHNFLLALHRPDLAVLHVVLLEGESVEPDAVLADFRARMSGPFYRIVAASAPRFVVQGIRNHQIEKATALTSLQCATDFNADLVVAFDIIPAWFAAEIPARRRLTWLGDLNFQTTYYHGLYGLRERPWRLIPFLKYSLAATNWKRVYSSVLSRYDEVIVSAASSVEQLEKIGLRNHSYHPYPWPADALPRTPLGKPNKPTFMFFGNLVGLGSRSALHFMVEQVYRRLLSVWGKDGFSILIAGRGNLPNWFAAAISDKPEFVRIGFVEDLPSTLSGCHAVLVPIDVPVGNRTRILYALSQGIPVIAHSNVALGNPALVDDKTCALAKDGASFVARMQRAYADPDWSRRIGEAGYDCYRRHFHPDRANAGFMSRVEAHLAVD